MQRTVGEDLADRCVRCPPGILIRLVATAVTVIHPCYAERGFTVTDDIELVGFGHAWGTLVDAVTPSPDGQYVIVYLERGRLALNRSESILQVFNVRDVRRFLERPDAQRQPAPIWVISRATYKNGPIISHIHWAMDSHSFAFLARVESGRKQLVIADLDKKTLQPLTSEKENVRAFDIRDPTHFVYAVESTEGDEMARVEQSGSIVGTGRSLYTLLFPVDNYPSMAAWSDRSELWAVIAGRRFVVRDPDTARPLVLYSAGQDSLAISPDARELVTQLPVTEIPDAWVHLYPPPFESYPHRLRSGRQDLQALSGHAFASQYVLINLLTGTVKSLTHAPTANAAGWPSLGTPVWSGNGQAILLPATFLASSTKEPSHPCVAVINAVADAMACVERLKGLSARGYAEGAHYIKNVRFEGGDQRRVLVDFYNLDNSQGTTEYRQTPEGDWAVDETTSHRQQALSEPIELAVKQGLNDPPVLVATDIQSQTSKVILNPNPQLEGIPLGEAIVYTWRNDDGRQWKGGLFMPSHSRAGRRYPLVIQTHGFVDSEFRPYGMYPTAFAARELAAAGIIVLQMQDCAYDSSQEEGSCNVAGYEAAVKQLTAEGLVAPDRIGIVGFSRTCYFVMKSLTENPMPIAAASITDGIMNDYMQYMASVDAFGNGAAAEADAMIGASPFGDGLAQWLRWSPGFNMEKVMTPLLVVALGRPHVLDMWLPYAELRYLMRPVDLIVINSDEHVLTNPIARLTSQGSTVDWSRFWLQGYEDPDPAKVEQYRRWEHLCDTQVAQNPNQPAFCVRSKPH